MQHIQSPLITRVRMSSQRWGGLLRIMTQASGKNRFICPLAICVPLIGNKRRGVKFNKLTDRCHSLSLLASFEFATGHQSLVDMSFHVLCVLFIGVIVANFVAGSFIYQTKAY